MAARRKLPPKAVWRLLKTWGEVNMPPRKPGGTMKFRNSPFLLTLALIVSSPLMSHASACSNSTIRGSYAFTIHGTIFLPNGTTLLIDGIAKESFDGQGNETQVDAVATNASVLANKRRKPVRTPVFAVRVIIHPERALAS